MRSRRHRESVPRHGGGKVDEQTADAAVILFLGDIMAFQAAPKECEGILRRLRKRKGLGLESVGALRAGDLRPRDGDEVIG